VLFVVIAVVGLALVSSVKPASLPDYSGFDPALLQASSSIQYAAYMDNSSLLGEVSLAESPDDFAGFVLADMSSYLNTSPATSVTHSSNGLLIYRVQEGDTLSIIAANFGISINTVIWANNIRSSSLLKPGQEIVILPVSGILHEVKEGETIDYIAKLYEVTSKDIVTFNKNKIIEGDTVIVPNAKPVKTSASNTSGLPSVKGYLSMPVEDGWNWGILHDNAVDISTACGTPIYAAAEGLVTDVGSPKSWNSGYGGFVRIKHPLYNTETFYAHTSSNLVSVGDYVNKGDKIAKVGKTGLATGPTGCHVHFGVFGAKHPFTK